MATLFQITAAILAGLFLYYGLDVRRKEGAWDFVAPAWQTLVKLCSFSLVGAFVWFTVSVRQVNTGDWLDLAVMASGTTFVMAAKRALGKAHTFTGQYLERPELVTRGVYSITRNPLYFGVLQCELGASLFVVHQAATLRPQVYPYWIGILAAVLLYVVVFNWNMAIREACYLRRYFGEEYRRYSGNVPFIFPVIRVRKKG